MHNDDQTTMDFVVEVLMQIFRLNYQQSMKVMLKVHKEGQCQVAKYRSPLAFALDSSAHL